MQDRVDSLRAHLGGLDFQYSDPYRNFDRSTVKGVVAKLFHIKPDFVPPAPFSKLGCWGLKQKFQVFDLYQIWKMKDMVCIGLLYSF